MASWREILWGKDDKGLKIIKQLAAGVAEGTIANTSESGGYRPAVVDSIPAVAAVVGQLINRRKDGKAFSGDTATERFLNDSLRRAQLGTTRTNRTLGIENPANTDELAARVTGSFLLRTPKGEEVAKVVGRTPKGAQVVERTKKTVEAIPKPIRNTAKIAGEIVTPFRTTSGRAPVVVGGAVTGIVDTVMDETVDPATGTRYKGTVPKLLGVETATPIEADPEAQEIETLMMQTAIETGDISEEQIAEMLGEPLTEEEVAESEEDDKLSNYEKAAIALGSVLGGGALLKYGGDFLKRRQEAATAVENIGQFPEFTGKKFRKSRLSAKDKFVTEVFEQERPIISMADEFLGRAQAQKFGYKADALSNASIGSKVRHFVRTGRMPGTNMRTHKLAAHAEAYAKELTQEEQRLVSDALVAASSLDDYRRTGTQASLNRDRFGANVNPRQLEMLVQQVRSNPKLAKYYDVVQSSYDDMLKYRTVRNLDTYETYQKFRSERPNYVPHNRNLEPDVKADVYSKKQSANDDFGIGAARTEIEAGGISGVTGVGNPFVTLFDDWAGEIRRAEVNDYRSDFLRRMEATGATDAQGHRLVKKVNPRGPIGSTEDGVHRVRVNGKDEYYQVRDPEVARALHFTPRLAIKGLEELKNFGQNLTTGPIATLTNAFGLITAPLFESMAAATLRGKDAGILNRLFVGGYAGGARVMWDEMRGAVGQNLRSAMIMENPWIKQVIGDQNLNNLATYFENAFENSIKAEMDELGITSTRAHTYSDPSKVAAGLEDIMPTFYSENARQSFTDIERGLREGTLGKVEAALKTGKNAYAMAKSNSILRAYTSAINAMHSGAKYSAYAARRGRRGQDLDKLVSDIRRLAADPSRHGANDKLNAIVGANMYGTIAMQTLYEIGRQASNPKTLPKLLWNASTTAATLAGLTYMSMATDPEALERYMNKSPQQKATSLSLWNGIEMKLDPIQRVIMGMTMPFLDQVSGLNEGNFDPNFLNVMERWLSGDAPQMDEASWKDFELRASKGFEDNLPVSALNPAKLARGQVDLTSFPLGNIAIAGQGADPGMSRMTGEVSPVREQDLTGFEEGKSKPGSMLNAQYENMLFAFLSSAGRNVYSIADDMFRAVDGGATGKEAFAIGADSWKEKAYKGAGVARPLFGNREEVNSASDVNYQLLKDKTEGMDRAIAILDRDERRQGGTGMTFNKEETLENVPVPDMPPTEGTELEAIMVLTKGLKQVLAKNEDILGVIGTQIDQIRAQNLPSDPKLSLSQDRNTRLNQLNEERKYQRMLMLQSVRDYEEVISDRIGRNFSYDDFKPEEYLNPVAPKQ